MPRRLMVVEGVQHAQAGSHGGEGSDAAIAMGATSREETEADGTREREIKLKEEKAVPFANAKSGSN